MGRWHPGHGCSLLAPTEGAPKLQSLFHPRSCLRLDPLQLSWALPGSRTRGLAEGSAWEIVPSRASSPQVTPGEQKAQCQRHSPHAVPPHICCPCWDMFGATRASGQTPGAAGRCRDVV